VSVESALRAVIAHWDEFGPEHGLDECIDQARRALAAPVAVVRRSTGYVAPKDRYVPPVLFNPYNGEPRDVRDVQTDPQGILIRPPGALLVAAGAPTGEKP
jgi:hypothetical protein